MASKFQVIFVYLRKKWLSIPLAVITLILVFGVYSVAASPFSSDSFVQSPFTTRYVNGQVVLTQRFTPRVYHNWLTSTLAYGMQAATDVWDRLSSPKEPGATYQTIVAQIHAQRFDPSQPYLISGDQFDAFYPRNLGVFYEDLLDKQTALNSRDWHNRERLAVQSLAYAMAATQQLKAPVTTLTPVSPRGVAAVNFWNYPSDTMFSLFQMLQQLKADPETSRAATQLQRQYGSGLQAAYLNYLATVRDPKTGLIRSNIHISSARDAAQRQSSFYDNVILWRTEQLATQLGYGQVPAGGLASLRQTILERYWDSTQGHFIDDVAPGHQHSYSSDWLIALPTGFLQPSNPSDLSKLELISTYIDQQRLAQPLPIRYTADVSTTHQDFFVCLFVGSYGNTAIWSYWGDQYMTLETDLYKQTGRAVYARHTETALAAWRQVIVRDRGYPETLNARGKMLETPFYESIRRNGWVIGYETAAYNWRQAASAKVSSQ